MQIKVERAIAGLPNSGGCKKPSSGRPGSQGRPPVISCHCYYGISHGPSLATDDSVVVVGKSYSSPQLQSLPATIVRTSSGRHLCCSLLVVMSAYKKIVAAAALFSCSRSILHSVIPLNSNNRITMVLQ